MNAFRSPLPGNLRRTIASAADDPEDRVDRHRDRRDDQRQLEGVDRVRVRERVPGRLEAVLERPPEDHRERPEQDRGEVAERRPARQRTYAWSCLVAKWRITPIEQQHGEGDDEQHDGRRGGAGLVAALDPPEDEDRRDLGLVRQVAGDDHERAELADGLGERERRRRTGSPGGCSGRRSGGTSSASDAPSERAASSISWSSSSSTGCTVRTTNGSVTNSSAERDRRARVGDVDADRRPRPVEREQRQAGDDRRQRERQVDHRVHDRLAAEVVADEHPGRDRPEHGVEQRPRAATCRA